MTKTSNSKQKQEDIALPTRIHDSVIILVSLIAHNTEMMPDDRECARKWLDVFNDTSPEFNALWDKVCFRKF